MTDHRTHADVRIQQILARPIPPPSRGNAPPDRYKRQTTFFIPDDAYHQLKDRAPGPKYVGAYLDALVRRNPTYRSWRDTRPRDLKDGDVPRATAEPPKLPLWSYGEDRNVESKGHRLTVRPQTTAAFAALARVFGIGRARYVTRTDIGTEGMATTRPNVLNDLTPITLAGYAIEAFARGYLTPFDTRECDHESIGKIVHANKISRRNPK